MLQLRSASNIFLVMMGSIDCLTTVVGTLYFRAVELNPLLAGIASTNLPAFIAIKLAATICVSFAFIRAEKTLMGSTDKSSKSFTFTRRLLGIAYAGIILFLIIVVANNILVLTGTL